VVQGQVWLPLMSDRRSLASSFYLNVDEREERGRLGHPQSSDNLHTEGGEALLLGMTGFGPLSA
jgi:hypothetical protein